MRVFISSPLRSGTEEKVRDNIRKAAGYCRVAYERGVVPLAPHVYLTQFMTAGVEEEDKWAMDFGQNWMNECHALWVFDKDGISAGMKEEIAYAKILGIPILYQSKGEI